MTETQRPICVVVDALSARFGGTAFAAIQLAPRLAADPAVERVIVVTRRDSIIAAGLPDQPSVEVISLRRARGSALLRRAAWQAFSLPVLLRRVGADCVLSLSGMVPRELKVPVVSHLLNPVAFQRRGLANERRRSAIGRTSQWAARILVPSSAMQALTEPTLGRRPAVVPLGVDHSRFAAPHQPGRDVVYVADFYRHKRHDLALAAWEGLAQPRPRMRFIGNPAVDPTWYREFVARIADEHGDAVSVESGLTLDELIAAYCGARASLLPSEDESFSMPLLESIACGVPAVARDLPVLHETGGPGCTFIEGDDPRMWSAALGRLVDDDDFHAEARDTAIAHSAKFSWDRMADDVRESLLSAVKDPRPQPPVRHRHDGRPMLSQAVVAGLAALGFAVVLLAAVLARSGTSDTPARTSDREPPSQTKPEPQRSVPKPTSRYRDPTIYGRGFDGRVATPLETVKDLLGRWHKLDGSVGHISVRPAGKRARYFYVAVFAFAPRSGELELTTEGGERETATLAADSPNLLTFGPLRAPKRGRAALQLRSSRGQNLQISPVMSSYLGMGEAIIRPEPLRQQGPGGVLGFTLPGGSTATFRLAPIQAKPPFVLDVAGVSTDKGTRIDATVGTRRRSARLGRKPGTLRLGPFGRAAETVTIDVADGVDQGVVIGSVRLRRP